MNTIHTERREDCPRSVTRQQGKSIFKEPVAITRLKNSFKEKPSGYYSMSVAATWAGVGSLMVGIQMAQNFGIAPFLLWAFGNTMACIVFGIFAPMIPKLRGVFNSKIMRFAVGIICMFQVWVNLNGIHAIFIPTPLTGTFGMAVAYMSAAVFIFLLLKFGMIRNVLTDNMSWTAVYLVGLTLTIAAIVYSRGSMNALTWGIDPSSVRYGLKMGLLLLPGPFLYPYFYEILNYNEKNEDGTLKVNVRRSFIMGGLLFGAYLIFTFLLAWTSFSPLLNTIKAFLIFLVAISTVSSFLYSIYITFGHKLGLAVNVAVIGLWQLLIPMGVLGVWTLMASIRIYIVIGGILFATGWHLVSRGKKPGGAA
jgi:hypothetical protein